MHPWALGRDGTHRTVSETDRRGKPLKTFVCLETGLVRNDPVPGDDELAKFYAEDYRKDYKASEKPRKRQILRNFRRVAAHVSQSHDCHEREHNDDHPNVIGLRIPSELCTHSIVKSLRRASPRDARH